MLQISLIIAVYNQSRYLPAVLASVVRQNVGIPYEVLICDDGSPDDTAIIVREWANQHGGMDVRYLWQPDRGFRLSRSRNNAIRCAQGDFLVFTDGDTWLAPYFLRDHWQAQVEQGGRLVCGARSFPGVDWESVTGQPDDVVRDLLQQNTTACYQMPCLMTDKPWVACCGGNFSIPAKHKIYFDEQFEGYGPEDRDYAYRLYASGLPVHWLPRCGALHHHDTENLSWNPFQNGNEESVIRTLRTILLLSRKHPHGIMAASLELARRFRLDATTDRWRHEGEESALTAQEVLQQFAEWQNRHPQ